MNLPFFFYLFSNVVTLPKAFDYQRNLVREDYFRDDLLRFSRRPTKKKQKYLISISISVFLYSLLMYVCGYIVSMILTFSISSLDVSLLEVGIHILTSSSNPEVANTGRLGWGSKTFTFENVWWYIKLDQYNQSYRIKYSKRFDSDLTYKLTTPWTSPDIIWVMLSVSLSQKNILPQSDPETMNSLFPP